MRCKYNTGLFFQNLSSLHSSSLIAVLCKAPEVSTGVGFFCMSSAELVAAECQLSCASQPQGEADAEEAAASLLQPASVLAAQDCFL